MAVAMMAIMMTAVMTRTKTKYYTRSDITMMTAVMISTAIIAPTSTVVMAAGYFVIVVGMTMYPTPLTRCAMAMVAVNLLDDGASCWDRPGIRNRISAEASSNRQSRT